VVQPVAPVLPAPALVSAPPAPAPVPAPEVPVQRVVHPEVPVEVPVERVTVQRVDEPGASATSTPALPAPGGGGGDPDELVKKIFDPLLRRLKAELLLDRDRRGVLRDRRY
jgi:hypothetical protein